MYTCFSRSSSGVRQIHGLTHVYEPNYFCDGISDQMDTLYFFILDLFCQLFKRNGFYGLSGLVAFSYLPGF